MALADTMDTAAPLRLAIRLRYRDGRRGAVQVSASAIYLASAA